MQPTPARPPIAKKAPTIAATKSPPARSVAQKIPDTRTKYFRPATTATLPDNWKTIVFETLRAHDGSAYARMLSARVFAGMGKINYSRGTKLRNELRQMVERGELLALGTNSDRQSAQMLYGLPDVSAGAAA